MKYSTPKDKGTETPKTFGEHKIREKEDSSNRAIFLKFFTKFVGFF